MKNQTVPVKAIQKGGKVYVRRGGLFPGYVGEVQRVDKEWNSYFVTVIFPGIDNPVRLNSDRLVAI